PNHSDRLERNVVNLTPSKSEWSAFWEEIKAHVTAFVGPTNPRLTQLLRELRKLHQERYANFYKIRYKSGEVILFKGTFTGYAQLLLRGKLVISERETPTETDLDSVPSCSDPRQLPLDGPVLRRIVHRSVFQTD